MATEDGAGSARLTVRQALVAARWLLAERRDELDALNVYPVPDADTGANVLATVTAAHDAVDDDLLAPVDAGPAAVEAAVRSARGNSGVLLAQVLRALFEVEEDLLDRDLADRLGRADGLARDAIADPVEGSVLSAVEAAAAAAAGVGDVSGLDQLLAATDAAHAEVARSPTRNEVLARAGVVDAGARAFALLLEAMVAAATGAEPAPPAVDVPAGGPAAAACTPGGGRYEVMYLLEGSVMADAPDGHRQAPDEVVAAVRDRLAAIGDSVVVVAGRRVVSVHVHTDDIGAAVAAGIDVGVPSELRVEDLQAMAEAVAAAAGAAPQRTTTTVLVGAAARGLRRLVAAQGAQVLRLDAGEWTATRLAAALGVEAADGPVVLLPGRGDVCDAAGMAASAVAAAVDVHVEVVDEAAGPAEVVAALAVLDPSSPSKEALSAAIAAARTGRVRVHGHEHADVARSVVALAERLGAELDGGPELVTLLLGGDLDAAARMGLADAVAAALPDVEVEVLTDAVPADVHVVVE